MTVEVMSCMTGYDEHVMATRAWIPPTTYLPYDVADKAIGICLTQDGQEPKQGFLFKSSGKWRTDIELTDPANYYLYGYAPHSPGMECDITGNSNYSDGAVMTINNVPSVTPSDICVVIGATNGKDDYEAPPADYRVTGLTRGNFYYQATANPGDGTGNNYIYLLFDHLYAALSFSMKVHGDYYKLRTIKLKELQVETSAGDEPTREKTDITVTLNRTDGSDPIESVDFEQKGAEMSAATVFTSAAGEELTLTPTDYQCHFMPNGITKIKLTSIYDVYDKNPSEGHPEGNLIRKDCKVTNTFMLSLFDQQTEFLRGRRYTINLTIKPTYLYMLSEPDLNSPSVVGE